VAVLHELRWVARHVLASIGVFVDEEVLEGEHVPSTLLIAVAVRPLLKLVQVQLGLLILTKWALRAIRGLGLGLVAWLLLATRRVVEL